MRTTLALAGLAVGVLTQLPAGGAELKISKDSKRLVGHTRPVTAMAFAPDGNTLASASDNGELLLWNVNTLQARKLLTTNQAIFGLAFLSNDRLAVAGKYFQIRILEIPTGKLAHQFAHEQGTVAVVALSPNAKVLASGGYNGEVALWDTQSWKKLFSLRDHPLRVISLAFSPDGKSLASGGIAYTEFKASNSDQVRLWDVEKGKLLQKFPGCGSSVAFTADGRYVVGAGKALWLDPNSPKRVAIFTNGKDHLVNGGQYTTFWSPQSGRKVGQLEGLGLGIIAVPGTNLFIAEIGTLHHWDDFILDDVPNKKKWGEAARWKLTCEGNEYVVLQRDAVDCMTAIPSQGLRFATLAPKESSGMRVISLVEYQVSK